MDYAATHTGELERQHEYLDVHCNSIYEPRYIMNNIFIDIPLECNYLLSYCQLIIIIKYKCIKRKEKRKG